MRLLHLTDTHLGARFSGRPVAGPAAPPRGWSRAQDHQDALDRALALADVLDVDAIVHTGDAFDRSKPPWRWVKAAAESLARAARKRPVVVLSGNHDRLGLTRTLPLHVPDLHIVDRPTNLALQLRSGSLRLACVPYRRNVPGFLHGLEQALGPGADLVLCHQAFDGVVVPGLTFRVGAQRDTVGARHFVGLPVPLAILCGHIHPRQVVSCGDVPVVHPGCLLHTAMRDRAFPEGIALWELGTRAGWRFLDLPGRPLVEVRSLADLCAVQEGAVVSVRDVDPSALDEVIDGIAARGGFLVGQPRSTGVRVPPAREQQLSMFAL